MRRKLTYRYLDIADFWFRYVIVDDIRIPLGEAFMIERFQPVWSKSGGFGNKTRGERRGRFANAR
jgi:hypothetical protein